MLRSTGQQATRPGKDRVDQEETLNLRVIGGKLRGRKLSHLPGNSIRPTADRIRESIFNILSDRVRDARVLDLFAGSGSLGIEALSRGAASAVFIDSTPLALSIIERNLEICRLGDRARVIRWDIVRNLNCLGQSDAPFELIFLDPPYGKDFVQRTLSHVQRRHLCSPTTCVVIEHAATEPIPTGMSAYKIEDQRKYGKTLVSFLSSML